jgi:hypothetical protein
MNYNFRVFATVSLFIGALGFASTVCATVPPTLALSATGSGDTVQIQVTGDPNVSVLLSYSEAGIGPQIASLGSTGSQGAFSETVSSATYGLTSGTPVTVILNGTGGPRSPTVAWPTVTSANSLTLSQNAAVLTVGSSVSVTATNVGSGLYVSNNSNPSIANANISGSQVTVVGNTAGSTTITICQVGTTTSCPSVYVTVEPSGAGQLSLSANTASVVSGQNLPITISGGNGVYQILNNSNSNVIQASISSSVLTLSTGASSGSASITVCTSDNALCGVVVATAGSASSVTLSFSNSAPVVSTSQGTTVTIYGPSGVQFYVSTNTNPSIVQANLSGTTLTLTGITAGSSAITVCASTGTCATLTATVQYVSTGGNLTISQNTLSLLAGQNSTITISGGDQPYFISGGTSSVSQETLNNTTLTVYGVATGTSSVNVCSAGGGCVLLVVTVNGGTNTSVTTVPSTSTPVTTTPLPTTAIIAPTPAITFTSYLVAGSHGAEVTALQQLLVSEGYLTATPNGNYGAQTKAAVIKFQAAHGLSKLGVVGPATRAALNQIEAASVSSVSNTSVATMTLAQLQAETQTLESQLTQVLNRISQLTGQ